jgi:hypothetical protein
MPAKYTLLSIESVNFRSLDASGYALGEANLGRRHYAVDSFGTYDYCYG